MAADVVAQLVRHDGGEFAVGQLVHGEAGDADDVARRGDRVQAVAVLNPQLVVAALHAGAGRDLAPDRFEFGPFLRSGVAQTEQTARDGAFGGAVEHEAPLASQASTTTMPKPPKRSETRPTTNRLHRKFGRWSSRLPTVVASVRR